MFNKPAKKEDCIRCNKRHTLFCNLNEEEIAYVNEHRTEASFNRGEIIFKQGTPMSHIACITKGMAKVYVEGLQNRKLIMAIVKPIYIVGGPGMWTDYMHHFTVTAIEDTTACFINIDVIKKLVDTNKEFTREILKRNNITIIKHYHKYINLAQKNVHGRMADMLLHLSRIVYEENPFTLNLDRQDMADYAAMSKEGVIRILKEFKDQGIVKESNDQFEILNFSELEKISQFG